MCGRGRQGVRLGALGQEGQGARSSWRGRGMRGARSPELGGAGLGGVVQARQGVGTGKGRPEGRTGVTRQTMSRWWWVVLGSWAVTN